MAQLARDRLVRVTRSDVGVDVAGRRATVRGELLLPPAGWRTWAAWGPWTFWASRREVEWDDGGHVTDEDRETILRVLRDSVAQIRHLELDLDHEAGSRS
jgi:hypothetical protein